MQEIYKIVGTAPCAFINENIGNINATDRAVCGVDVPSLGIEPKSKV